MKLTRIDGGGDVVRALERLLEEAKAGKLDGMVYATCARADDDEGVLGVVWRDDMPYPFPRLICAGDQLLGRLRYLASSS